jgi:hypothetical protein
MKTLVLLLAVAALAWGHDYGYVRWAPPRSNFQAGPGLYRIPQPDIVIVRDYYRGHRLPPGLAKQLARGRALPFGWQKRIQPVPGIIERRLAPLPYGYRRGIHNGAYVVYDSRRGVLVDFFLGF